MADNTKKTGNPDRSLINMNEDYEVRYWSQKWGITDEQLKKAGRKAQSSSVRKIRKAAEELGFINS